MGRGIVAIVALLAALSPAHAQFSGQLPPGSVLGNAGATAAPAKPVLSSDGTILLSGGAIAARVFDSTHSGIVAQSGGGTTNFLRADNTWTTPATPAASQRVAVGWDPAIDPNNNVVATIDEASTVASIVGTVHVAVGSTSTLSVYKAPSGTACSGGTVLHSGSFNANGTANTNQTLTLTTTALSAGDRVCVVTSDSANWLAGSGIGGVTVRLTTP